MIDLNKLKPFSKFCCSIGYIPTSYKVAMSYEEQLWWLCDFLEDTVIPAVNNNADAFEEVRTLFIELKNYVDNYFENLDVQEEINNKLDEMALDGTLQNIIDNYLNTKAFFGYNNVAEMLQATNLKNGSYAKTSGYYNKNDGGSASYKITNDENLTVDNLFVLELNNGLKAELIIENEVLNILQFGAKNDGSADISNILNALIGSSYNSIFFPQGQYLLDDKVALKSNMNLHGVFNGSNINLSINGQIYTRNDNIQYTNIQLRDLTIRCNGDRTNHGYAIHLQNTSLSKIMNCLIRSDTGVGRYNGVCFELANNSLHNYDNRVTNNQFQRACLRFINGTDNFITDNLIWGNQLLGTGALTFVQGCHNCVVSNNHFAVSEEGALRVQDTCNQIRIVNNYFDAQGIGIYANALSEAIITDNIFYHPQQAILINSLNMSSIANNTFRDCDINDEGYPDIKIVNSQGGNSFIGNKHFRTTSVTHNTKALSIDIPDASSSYPISVINMSTVAFSTYYNAIDTTLFTRNKFVNCYPASLFTE